MTILLVSWIHIHLEFLHSLLRAKLDSILACTSTPLQNTQQRPRAKMDHADMSMCNIHVDFSDDADFSFNSLSSGCSSASISGSSYASSSLGPHTPTSGRSTPPLSASLDFGSSFASSVDTVPFDLTPPSSATSTYFPVALKSNNVSDFSYTGFPITPSRAHFGFPGHPLNSCGGQLTPSQTMDYGFFMSDLGPHPLLSTPYGLNHGGQPSDTCSLWVHAEGPISFEEHSPSRFIRGAQSIKLELDEDMMVPQSVKLESEEDMMFSVAARRRARMEEVRLKTTALRDAQQGVQPNARARIKAGKQLRTLVAGSSSVAMENIQPGKFKCPHEGCKTGPYRRNEHLKRHIQS